MNYLEELINRSMILWQSLFGETGLQEKELSVEINPILFVKKTDKKYEQPQKQGGAAYEGTKTLNLLQETENAQKGNHFLNMREEMDPLRFENVQTRITLAKNLMQNLRRIETANVAGAYLPVEHGNEGTPDLLQMADPVSWSEYFERDARRYDGGYELM